MSKIFPTFKEIENGYCVYDKPGVYKGTDEFGEPVFSKRLSQDVVIKHRHFNKYVAIDIKLDRKGNRIAFKYGYDDKRRSREFDFSEDGYKQMLKAIRNELQYDLEMVSSLLDELERLND